MSPRHLLIVLLILTPTGAAVAQPAVSLEQVRGGVYTWREGNQSAVVFVAPEAILVADPLSVTAALRLREELTARFPRRPIRRVVYTRHILERAIAGIVFPEADAFGHATFNDATSDALQRDNTNQLPDAFAPLDANRNQLLESHEWTKHALTRYLSSADANKDGALTVREVRRLVGRVQREFHDGTTIAVGSKQVQVLNRGGASATAAVFFPEERLLYAGLNPAFASDGFAFADTNPRAMLEWLHAVGALPFDTILLGRDSTLTRDEFSALVRYVEELQAAAIDSYALGLSVEQAATVPALRNYAGSPVDGRRRANLAAIFRTLGVTRVELRGAGLARWMSKNGAYCADHDACESGGDVIGGTGGLRVVWSTVGVVVEGGIDDQFLTSREGFFDDQAYMQRSARGSLLFRLGQKRPTAAAIDLLAGATMIVADIQGIERIKQAVAPFGGRHAISERTRAWGGTVGIDLVLPLSRSISLYLPVRATSVPRPPEHWPGYFDVQGGIGFSVRLSQSVR